MATTYGTQMTKLRNSSPVEYPLAGDVGGRVRCFNERIDLASQPSGDTIEIAKLPKGARVLFGILNTDTSLGSSTLAIGNGTSSGKYRAAATFTSTNTPTFFGVVAGVGEALTAEEIVLATIAAANLPSSGILRIMIFYTLD
jgi:hypothetical protein